jgi:hypothetical protein
LATGSANNQALCPLTLTSAGCPNV